MLVNICRILFFVLLVSPSFATDNVLKILQGEFVQGGMLIAQLQPGSRLWVDDQKVIVSEKGVAVWGYGRDAAESSLLKVQLPDPGKTTHTIKKDITTREYRIQRIDGLPASKVNPPESTWKRIKADNAQVGRARRVRRNKQEFQESFIWPSLGPISGVYGSQRVLNGDPKRPHYGVDVAAPTGTIVVAPASGLVTLSETDMYYTGGTVIIDHGQGVNSTLMHMSKVTVKADQYVKQGEKIGEIGATGRATGPHLDWRMNWAKQRIDPQLVVGDMPSKPWKCSEQLPQACP